MLTFLIVVMIMTAVSFADFKALLKEGPKRLVVFYAASLGLSVVLTAFYCYKM